MSTQLITPAKTSLIRPLGMAAAFALRRRSAALRHWILAAAVVCAATAPVLWSLAPSWTLPSLAAPATTHTPDLDVSFRPIGTPAPPAVAAASAPPSGQMPLLAPAADLF